MHALKSKIRFIEKENSDYPALLKEIGNPPSGLYILGDLPDEKIPRLAIVGTRKATSAGRLLAKKISQKLSDLGIIIVSGLAMGIDTAAHEGAVAAGAKTIAVLGNGLAEIYPRQNENLAQKILECKGAIISEYAPETPALPHQFLERNRIVSGLCLGVIVIEAPIDSGALVTARLAAEQGREVFVFPGPHDHPNFRGSHKLIRDGARLVASVEDILEDLGVEIPNDKFPVPNKFKIPNFKLDENQLAVFGALQKEGRPLIIDKIVHITNLEPQDISRAITFLVINNIIKETERGYII